MKLKKKWMAAVLMVSMLLTMLPMTVLAAEEDYEAEMITESYVYKFMLEDGTIVDGTNVVISLCNEIDSEDKVVIAEGNTGEGEFTISHMGDFYYYEGEKYTLLEIIYSFPEGYILADSENVTKNTVWYSVENLYDGSNSITWILEEMKEQKPEVPVESETPVEPDKEVEENPDKLVEETVEQIKKQEDQHVQVVVSESNKINKEIFESMKEHEKDVTIGVKDKDGDKLYLYYYDEEEDKVLRIGEKPLEVKDGYIEYTITHCSTYFVMEDNLTNVEKDETSLADATLSVLDNDFDKTLATNASLLFLSSHNIFWFVCQVANRDLTNRGVHDTIIENQLEVSCCIQTRK